MNESQQPGQYQHHLKLQHLKPQLFDQMNRSRKQGSDHNTTTSEEEWPVGDDIPEDVVRSSGDGDTNPDDTSGRASMLQSSRIKTSPRNSRTKPIRDDLLSEIDANISAYRRPKGGERRSRTKKQHLENRKFQAEDEDSFDSVIEINELKPDVKDGSKTYYSRLRHTAPPSKPPLMTKVVLRKESDDNFGFSIADGLFESGVYIKRVRRQGPAEVAGVKRFDKILLVNGLSAKDANVEQLLPLFDACERALELTICRYDPLMEEGLRGGGGVAVHK